jgi:hypothetical protein
MRAVRLVERYVMRFPSIFRRGAVSALLSCSVLLPLSLVSAAALADDAPPAAPATPAAPGAAPKDTVRSEVGVPLQAAQALIKEKKFKEALAKVKDAEAVPNRTGYENFMIESMRASAAGQNGDDEMAANSYEALVSSGRLAPPTQIRIIQALAGTYFKLKNYPKAASWASRYLKDGGTEPSVQDILFASYYYSNDFKAASAELQASVDADEKAGRTPSESHLQMLLNSDQKIGNGAGAGAALEKLLTFYPQKQYWEIAISHVAHRSGAERLDLDLLRLENALGDLHKESEYMDLAQLALEAGFPIEAKKVLDQGFAAGVLGKGSEAERQKRLLAKAAKDAADDQKTLGAGDADAERAKSGEGMVNTGYNYVLNGKFEHGLTLIEQGLKKGGLRHPEDGKLHLGIAYNLAGDKAKATQILHTVQGTDGAADLAHLWAVYINSKR